MEINKENLKIKNSTRGFGSEVYLVVREKSMVSMFWDL